MIMVSCSTPSTGHAMVPQVQHVELQVVPGLPDRGVGEDSGHLELEVGEAHAGAAASAAATRKGT